jgi:hypothetical protein
MEPTQDKYPIFEVNQVLSNSSLNQVFSYLDEQERLTRANLIGIGIACGLEIRLEVTATEKIIHLSKGCGVSTQGYLLVAPEDEALKSYREYPTTELDYPAFKDGAAPYSLWEMFPAGEPNTTPLGSPPDFLNDKAVLLFLELKKEGLRNCSPNDCRDKGSEVTATVRRLLIKTDDLKKIIDAANALAVEQKFTVVEEALRERLVLPDLRLPRYNAPNTGPATSNEVLAAFLAVFHNHRLAHDTAEALAAAYQAFKPVLQETYPANPFADFMTNFGFLDNVPTTTAQVRFLQYYYDLFDDLLKGYDEIRGQGMELLCACCPPSGLFERHLMLGVLFPGSVTNPESYRHRFLPSPALGGCGERTQALVQLFRRLKEMITRFTNNPPLPQSSGESQVDGQIRITPTRWGQAPLSHRTIPYYYRQTGAPPLYRLWNPEKTRRNRDHHNLSYRSDEYSPAAPVFVSQPLRYDLEPYGFLRVEGHLGKHYQRVLATLLFLKTRYRLPIEIIALRTGAFDENMPVDFSKEACRFRDLESLYDTLREELLSFLVEGVRYFYDIAIPGSELAGGTPQLPLLKKYAPNYRHKKGTVGAWHEKNLVRLQSLPYLDVDQNKIDPNAVFLVYCALFYGIDAPPAEQQAPVVAIYYLSKLAEVLPSSLNTLGYADFENKYQDLMGLIRYLRSGEVANLSDELKKFTPQEDLIDHFDQVLFSCKLEPIKAIHEEYERRLREVKQKQFLSFFLQKHPGIQHKAGVPLGGTFILAYHEEPDQIKKDLDLDEIKADLTRETSPFSKIALDKVGVAKAFKRLGAKPEYAKDPDINYLLGAFTGQTYDFTPGKKAAAAAAGPIIAETIDGFANGAVIADFFLPYLCCSDCPPVQYVLPVPPVGLEVKLDCTDPNGTAVARLTPKGGAGPFTYQLDQQPFKELVTDNLVLAVGPHTLKIRDSAGAESALQTLEVPDPLTIGAESFTKGPLEMTYLVSFPIFGGTPPYTSKPGEVKGDIYTSVEPVKSGTPIKVTITDSVGCEISKEFTHTVKPPCLKPCEGQSQRCAYRLWLQPPFQELKYKDYKQESAISFTFNGEVIALPGSDTILQIDVDKLNTGFDNAIGRAITKLNHAIEQALIAKFGAELGAKRLELKYEPARTDPFAILWIESFVCETFSIKFDFSCAKPAPAFRLTMQYASERSRTRGSFKSASLFNRGSENKETQVPAFDCRERNQCTGGDEQKLCKGPDFAPDFTLARTGETSYRFVGKAPPLNLQISAWVWDFLLGQATEPYYQGESVVVELQQPTGPVKLTAITKQGCFGVVIKPIVL